MKKLKGQKGFTLVEMLIVVAIIAILVAVSIPVVGSALERAREATDAANERAFKAALLTSYLQGQAGMNAPGEIEVEFGKVYCYDAVNGKICENATEFEPYGKAKRTYGGVASDDHTGKYLWGHVGGTIKKYEGEEMITEEHLEVFMGWNSKESGVGQGGVDSMSLVTTWWMYEE